MFPFSIAIIWIAWPWLFKVSNSLISDKDRTLLVAQFSAVCVCVGVSLVPFWTSTKEVPADLAMGQHLYFHIIQEISKCCIHFPAISWRGDQAAFPMVQKVLGVSFGSFNSCLTQRVPTSSKDNWSPCAFHQFSHQLLLLDGHLKWSELWRSWIG